MVTDQWLGTELAGYRLDAVLGRGGAGVVYRATHVRLQRPAAVKLLPPALAADAEYRRRFEREARLAAGLHHPHIVSIYNAGHENDVLYLAMAYVDGPNLAAVVEQDGPMDLHRVCGLLTGIAEALDSAHHSGLVHRDVKPANMLLAAPGERAYLCGFGIARHTSSSSTLTTNGQFLGTLQYCAPEQIQGQAIDGRADQYALGCVVYHCLTGQVPYPGDEPSAVMFAHISADPPRASAHNPTLPPAVDDMIARALAKQPAHRYPDCTAFLHSLTAATTITAAAGGLAAPPRPPQPGPPAPGPPHTVIWPAGSGQSDPRLPSPESAANHTSEQPRRISRREVLAASVAFAVLAGICVLIGQLLEVPVIARIPISDAAEHTVTPGLAIAPDGRRAYFVGSGAVSVIDVASNAVTATVPVPGISSGGVTITPDGRHAYITKTSGSEDISYLACFDDPDCSNVRIIDTASNTVVNTVRLSGSPHGAAFTPDGRYAYIPIHTRDDAGSAVQVIDTDRNSVIATIPIPDLPLGVVIPPDGRSAYVGDIYSGVQVIDISRNVLTGEIPLIGNQSPEMAASPDGRHVYITTLSEELSPQPYHVMAVDTAANAVAATIPVSSGGVVAVAPDGRHVYVASYSHEMLVIDTTISSVVETVRLPCYPSALSITPDGRQAYVGCVGSVAVVGTGA